MTTEVKFRRGTTAEHSTFTGAAGEMTVDTDKDRVVIHDGVKAGGFPTPNFKDLQDQAMVYGAASGTNTLTITLSPAPSALVAGFRCSIKIANNNTAAVTLNPNGLGAKAVKKNGGADDLDADDFVAGGVYTVIYDGTDFQLNLGASIDPLGVAQVWIEFTIAGVDQASLNVTSVTDNGTGSWTVNVATDFSSANFACGASSSPEGGSSNNSCGAWSATAGTIEVRNEQSTGAANDTIENISAWAFGAQV